MYANYEAFELGLSRSQRGSGLSSSAQAALEELRSIGKSLGIADEQLSNSNLLSALGDSGISAEDILKMDRNTSKKILSKLFRNKKGISESKLNDLAGQLETHMASNAGGLQEL